MIGQFGVGFYASFIVADKVVVTTRRAGSPEKQGVRWCSSGEGSYEIEAVACPQRGTTVVLHLKSNEEEFLNAWRLKQIITKYSDHLTLPVVMKNDKNEEETVNRATALWTLAKSEITDEQYKEFYKHIAYDFEDPLVWVHNKVEGKTEYTTLLYIPSHAPFDLSRGNKTTGLKLYVKRVFILDDAEQFLPNYLRFVKGIVDCNDLPLNISREILQHHRLVETIKSAITKRLLNLLEELTQDKEKYQRFWSEFGQVLKEGILEDFSNKEQIASLLRFATTCTNKEKQETSLDDYITQMPPDQKKIYYLAAQSFKAAKQSPHLEVFNKKGIEVLLLSEPIDEWLASHLSSYKDKPLQSITTEKLDLEDLSEESQEALKQTKETFSKLVGKIKEVLKDKVKDVRLSQRLTESPACLISDEQGLSPQMEKIMRASGQVVPLQKPILEINPNHTIVQHLNREIEKPIFEDWAHVLFEQAILADGRQLEEPANFVKAFNDLLKTLL